ICRYAFVLAGNFLAADRQNGAPIARESLQGKVDWACCPQSVAIFCSLGATGRNAMCRLLTLALAVLVTASVAQAVPVMDLRVDFNNAAASPGTGWNTVASTATDLALVDFNTGVATAVTLTTSASPAT